MRLHPAALAVATVALAAAGLVARSGAAPVAGAKARAQGGTLRVGLTGAPSVLDPTRAANVAEIAGLGLEKLMKIAADGFLKPYLAQSVRQPNAFAYEYTIRKGVKFWDGRELTAEDVANALNYNRYPGSRLAFFYTSVRDIKAVGRYKVVVTLKRRDASWKWVPANFGGLIFEKKFGDEHKGSLGRPGVLTMGTGPWIVDSFDPTQGAELSANPHWWGGKVPFQHISIKFFADETSEALAFRSGAIDVAPVIGNGQAFAATSGAKLLSAPGCGTAVFAMNTGAPPWNDVHVRPAVAYALNRSDIIRANGGYATSISTLIPPVHLRAIASQKQVQTLMGSLHRYPHDLAKARQEMVRSARRDGFSDSLPEYGPLVSGAQVIAAELQAIGIKADVKTMTIGAWAATITGPPADRPATFTTAGCNSPDPSYNPSLILGQRGLKIGQFNVANHAPNTVEDLLNEGTERTDPAKRLAIYGQLLKRLGTDVPYVPLFVSNTTAALASNFTWTGYNGNPQRAKVWALEIKRK